MYLIVAPALAVAAVPVTLIKKLGFHTISGEPIPTPRKTLGRGVRYAAGGTLFGLGWALTGAWVYGLLRPKLPR